MYLKKLELFGFKSFADRTTFEFEPGVTCIVGPNGCGKSNVVDAFKWILGSQSPKGLRGSEMKDVIFNGTQSRKPLGLSEVTVVFENEDRYFDVDYVEVAVTRRLFRSGESEYLINKQKCRLKDIKDLFLDTGFGASSYSILEQGKIDVLLQASVIDRRVIFEEAAGISKYRVRKAEALRSLARVQDNLVRLQDLLDEVEKRVRRVKSQASKARRYRSLSERLKDLRVRMALEDLSSSIDGRSDLSFGLFWVVHRVDQLEGLGQRLSAGLDVQIAKRRDLLCGLEKLREELSSARVAKERTEEKLEQSERRLVELAEEEKSKKHGLEDARATLEHLTATLEEERGRLESFRQEIVECRHGVEARSEALRREQEADDELQRRVNERKEEIVSLIQQRSKVANHVVQLTTELGSLQSRKERLETAHSRFVEEVETGRRQASVLAETIAAISGQRDLFEKELALLELRFAELEVRVSSVDDELRTRREELHRKSSRFEVLASFETALDGVSSGAAELLRRREELPAVAEVHGLVASLLRIDPRYAPAVEAAVGERAQSFVVETQDGAMELLDFVRDQDLGGVQIVSLDRLDRAGDELSFLTRQGGVLGRLSDFVDTVADHEDLVDRLLGGVVLVEDFKTAVALSRNGLRACRLVTLAGELVEPWGALSVPGSNETGIISRRSEMDALSVEVEKLDTECAGLEADRDGLHRELAEVREHVAAKKLRVDETTRRGLEQRAELAQVETEIDRLGRELEVGAAEVTELDGEISSRLEEKSVRVEEIEDLDSRRVNTEKGVAEVEEEIARGRERLEHATEAVSQSRLALAQAEKQEEGRRRLLDEQAANLREREKQSEGLERDIGLIQDRVIQTRDEQTTARRERETILVREREVRAALDAEEEKDRSLLALEQGFRDEIEAVRVRASELAREREGLHLRDQEERHRRNNVLERIDEEYGIDLQALLATAATGRSDLEATAGTGSGSQTGSEPETGTDAEAQSEAPISDYDRFLAPVADWDREVARKEARELQERIRKLGNVNLEALEELEELEERHRFQIGQKSDLVDGERHLRGIIAEINSKSRQMFQETFDSVQEHFKELFRKCFGGGRAELVLEEGVDVLEAGIEIVARPPGKKLTSLSLMSGGERTMTTIALLLSIFRARPSPFCILDEVDAPLDEANVHRFTVLLNEFVESSQFIIITHNKVTMSEANTLYGVTMQERGVSNRVAVELETYDPEKMESLAATASGD